MSMRKKTYLWKALIGIAMVGNLALTSCSKDEGYDLENIDGTVGLSVRDFIIPGINSTMSIPLKDVFDISNSEIISTDAEGNYIFEKKSSTGDVKPAHPSVDKITVVKQSGQREFQIDINTLNNLEALPSGVPDAAIDAAFDVLWGNIPAEFHGEGRISVFNYENDIDDDVQWLDSIGTDVSGSNSTIFVNLKLSDAMSQVVERVAKIEVELPTFLVLSATNIVTGTKYTPNENGVITLTNVPSTGIYLKLTIGGLKDFAHSKVDGQKNALVMQLNPATGKQHLSLDGEAYARLTVKRDDMENKKGNLKQLLRSNTTNVYQLQATTQLNDIIISSAKGQFKPEIDLGDIGGVAITGLPDFLNGENVRLVVANPQIYIDIDSDLGLDGVITNVRLTSSGSKVQQSERVVNVDDLTILRSPNGQPKRSSFVIFDEGNANKLTPPEGRNISEFQKIELTGKVDVKNRLGKTIQVGRLASLLYEIPDSIKFSARGTTTLDKGSIELGHSYTVQPSYTFKAPLTLNNGSYVVYNDSIDGWYEDLEDLTISGKAEVKVTVGEAINQLPLNLTLQVTPKFIDGTPVALKDKVQTSVDKTINAKDTNGGITNDVVITLIVDGNDAFKHLDGFKFEALAETYNEGQAEALKEKGQTLKLNKIGGKITGTFIIEDDDDK